MNNLTWDELINLDDIAWSFQIEKPGTYHLLPNPSGFSIFASHLSPFHAPPEGFPGMVLEEQFNEPSPHLTYDDAISFIENFDRSVHRLIELDMLKPAYQRLTKQISQSLRRQAARLPLE